jgi:hypothetical protein
MEPSGRNEWQPVANAKSQRTAELSRNRCRQAPRSGTRHARVALDLLVPLATPSAGLPLARMTVPEGVIDAVSENEREVVPTFSEGGGYSQLAWTKTRSGFFGVSWIRVGRMQDQAKCVGSVRDLSRLVGGDRLARAEQSRARVFRNVP